MANDVILTRATPKQEWIKNDLKYGLFHIDSNNNLVINSYSGSYTTFLTGSVGVGTTSPTTKFHVIGGASSTVSQFESTCTSVFTALKGSGGNYVYVGNKSGMFTIQTSGNSYSDKLIVTTGGNVGIGTTTPAYKLQVSGSTSLYTGKNNWNYIGPNALHLARESYFGYSNAYRVLQLGTATTNCAIAIGVDVSGNPNSSFGGNEIIFPNQSEIITPNVADNGYLGVFSTDNADKLRIGNYNWNLLGNTPGITIDTSASTNYVGIRTTTPSVSLTVEGSISASGDFYLDGKLYDVNNSTGTSGQILSSTGTAVDWTNLIDISGAITGSGTTNTLALWNSSNSLSSSNVYQDCNGNVGINTSSPTKKLHVYCSDILVNGVTIGLGGNGVETGTADNIAFGNQALSASTNSRYNVAIGYQALKNNISAYYNLGIGYQALLNVKDSNANQNTAIGYQSLSTVEQGFDNVAIGADSMSGNESGSYNVAIGVSAGLGSWQSTDNYNIAIGHSSGYNDGACNISIGYLTTNASSANNSITIGHNSVGLGSNSTKIGNNSTLCTVIPAGNVGIGTTTPVSTLEIVNNNESTTQTNFTQALTAAGLIINTQYTANAYTPGLFWKTSDNNSTKPKAGIYLKESNNGTCMYLGTSDSYATGITNNVVINQNGNVGIGTTDPTATLHVVGNITSSAGDSKILIEGTVRNTNNGNIYGDNFVVNTTNKDTALYAYGVRRSDVTQGGIRLDGRMVAFSGSVGNPGVTFNNDLTSGIYSPTTNQLGFSTNGSERVRINSLGNVGIGACSPSNQLTTYKATSNYFPISLQANDIGTAGQYLGIQFGYTGGTYQKGAIIYQSADAYARGRMVFALDNNANSVNADVNDVVLALSSSGCVGIGTLTPLQRLHVCNGRIAVNDGYNIGSTNGNNGMFVSGDNVYFQTAGSTRVEVDSNGNVGIGTTTPSQKLQVAGNISGSSLILSNDVYYKDTTTNNNRHISLHSAGTEINKLIYNPSQSQIGESAWLIGGGFTNYLYNWEGRGFFLSSSVTGGSSVSNDDGAISPVSTGDWAIITQAGAGTVTWELTSSGEFANWGDRTGYVPYVMLRTNEQPTNIKVEYKRVDTGAWVTFFDDTPSFTDSLTWANGTMNTNTGNGLSGIRYTLTMDGSGTAYIKDIGLTHQNFTPGGFLYGGTNATNTWSGVNTFKSSVTTNGCLRLNSTLNDVNNSAGSSGQILSSTGTGVDWVNIEDIPNAISGSGTTNYLPLWTNTDTLGNSVVYQNSNGNIGIGCTNPNEKFRVAGTFSSNALWTNGSAISYWGNYTTAYGGLTWGSGFARVFANTGNRLELAANSSTIGINIATDGNVGIGTTIPRRPFEVCNATDAHIYIHKGTTTANDYSEISFGISTGELYHASIRGVRTGGGATGDLVFLTQETGGAAYSTLNEKMRIQSDGNVGIGTPSPTQLLEVCGGRVYINNGSNISPDSSGNGQFNIQGSGYVGYTTLDGTAMYIGHNSSTRDLRFQTNETDRVTIDGSSGFVGLNTTSPGALLHVSSSSAMAAIIESSNDYQLRVKGNTTWAGIQFCDAGGNDIVYFYGPTKTFSIGGGGAPVSGKKLHIDGGTSIGDGIDACSVPTNGLLVSGSVGIGTDTVTKVLDVKAPTNSDNHIRFANGQDTTVALLGNENTDEGFLRLYHAGTNWLTMRANGTSYIASGSLGIGCITPSYQLDVRKNNHQVARFTSTGTNTSADVLIVDADTSNSRAALQVQGNGGATEILFAGAGGNVGIGTTGPNYKLDVTGNARVTTDLFVNDQLAVKTSCLSTSNFFHVANTTSGIGGKASLALISVGNDSTFNTNVAALHIINSGNRGTKGHASGSDLLRLEFSGSVATPGEIHTIFNKDGNVGIGIAPSYDLHVYEATNSTDVAIQSHANNAYLRLSAGTDGLGTAEAGIIFTENGASSCWELYAHNDSFKLYDYTAAQLVHCTQANGHILFTPVGNVGIGTTSPSGGLLHVDGRGYFGPVGTGDATTKVLMDTYSVLKLKPHDTNSTNMTFAQVNNGAGIGIQVTNSTQTADWDIALNPFGGNVGIGEVNPAYLLHLSSSNNTNILGMDVGNRATYIVSANSTSKYTTCLHMDDTGLDFGHDSTIRSLNLRTGNTDRLTILGGGNVGIGTTNPTHTITLSSASDAAINLGSTAATTKGIYIYRNSATNYAFIHTNGSGDLEFDTGTSSPSTRLHIENNSGNIGIGTTSPNEKLVVIGTTYSRAGLKTRNCTWNAHSSSAAQNCSFNLITGPHECLYSYNSTTYMGFYVPHLTSINYGWQMAGRANSYFLRSQEAGTWCDWKKVVTLDFNGGEGTTCYIPKFDGSDSLVDSVIYEDASGNIGIGTTTPSRKLHVEGPGMFLAADVSDATILELRESTGGTNLATFRGTTSGCIFGIHSQNNGDIYIKDTSDNVLFYGKNGGNVGINTTTPYQKLSVNGAIESGVSNSTQGGKFLTQRYAGTNNDYMNVFSSEYSSGALIIGYGLEGKCGAAGIVSSFDNNTLYRTGICLSSNGFRYLQTTGSTNRTVGCELITDTKFIINTSGYVGIGTTSPSQKLHVCSGRIAVNDGYNIGSINANNGMFVSGDNVYFQTAGSTRVEVDSNGNVGIGTTNPVASLHVNSNATNIARFSGNGSAGTYIKLDESGTQAWVIGLDNSSTTLHIRENDTTGDAWLSILANSGNVGIGTTTPGYKLDVAGSISMHDEAQDLDSRYYGKTWLRGWSEFNNGSESDITYTTDSTSPVGTEVLFIDRDFVWVRGPKIRIDKTQNYQVEFWVKRATVENNGFLYFVVSNFDSNGNKISGDGTDWHYPFNTGQSNLTQNTWIKYSYIVGPYGGSKDHSPSASYISVGFIANYNLGGATGEQLYFTGFKCTPIPKYENDNLTLYNNGNVGIGTTSPTYKLDIDDDATTGAGLRVSGGGFGGSIGRFTRDVGGTGEININAANSDPQIQFYDLDTYFSIGLDDSANTFKISNSSAINTNDLVTIQTDGNVGIGTTSPTADLHVEDTVNGDVSVRIKNLSTGTSARSGLRIEDASAVGGNILINHSNYTGISAWANAMVISGDSALNNGIFIYDSDIIHLGNATSGDLHISSSCVGIGITSPEEKLHVAGNIRTDSGYGIGSAQSLGSESVHISVVGGGAYATSGNQTGYLKITLPQLWTNTMLRFKVDVYEYGTGKVKTFTVGGYNYSPSTAWINTSAFMETDSDSSTYIARFGTDGSNAAIYIDKDGLGASTSWSIPQVRVKDFVGGYSNYQFTKWVDGWDVTFTGTLGTITSTRSVARSTTATESGTTSYIPKFTGLNSLGKSVMYESGGNIGISCTVPAAKLHIVKSSTYNSEGTSGLKIEDGTSDVGVVMGADATNNVFYIQSLDPGTSYTTRPLVLNPNGGSVGIGTTSPSARLEVRSDGAAATGAEIRLQHANNNNTDVVSTVNFANNIGSVAMIQGGTTGANNTGYISFFTDNAGVSSEKMRIISDGNVGIGTASPETKLHVYHSDSTETFTNLAGVGIENAGSSNSSYVFQTATAGGGKSFSITNAGNVGIGTTSPSEKFSVNNTLLYNSTNNLLTITNSTNLGGINLQNNNSRIYFSGYRAIEGNSSGTILVLGEQYATTYVAGNLGIGTTSPSQKLEVAGNIRLKPTSGTPYIQITDTGLVNSYIKLLDGTQVLAIGDDSTNDMFSISMDTEFVGVGTLTSSANLHIEGSGSTLFKVDGYNGTLFSVEDDLSDSLMSVNDAAGLPVFEVFADDTIIGGRYNQNDFYLEGSSGNIGVGTSLPSAKFEISSSTADPIFNIKGASGDGQIYVQSDGNVGVGTTSPTENLHVIDSARIDGNLGIGGSPATGFRIYINGNIRADITTTTAGGSGGKTWQTWGQINVGGTTYYMALYQ